MRVVIQRCKYASCSVDGVVVSKINKGFMCLVGFKEGDTLKDVELLAKKTAGMRIFEDENSKMNLGLNDVNGDILAISQFTLYADCKKGNRPSFTEAMNYNKAIDFYDEYCNILRGYNINVLKGVFGADMQIELLNDGPVTIILDSDNL